MNYRDSSQNSMHLAKGVAAGVDSSHAAAIYGGSTGANFSVVGDDTNISVNLFGKGTGGTKLGNSSSPVTLAAGAAVKGTYSTTTAYTFTALAAGTQEAFSIASTTADVMPGDLFQVELGSPAVSTQTISLLGMRTSTATSSRITLLLGNVSSTAIGSTGSGTLRVTWFDLT